MLCSILIGVGFNDKTGIIELKCKCQESFFLIKIMLFTIITPKCYYSSLFLWWGEQVGIFMFKFVFIGEKKKEYQILTRMWSLLTLKIIQNNE